MTKRYFRINLIAAHARTGKTAYAIHKELGINQNTVRKYLTEVVTQQHLTADVVRIIEHLGCDWRDPAVVEVIETDDAEENQTALLATA